MKEKIRQDLVQMSHNLGDPSRDYIILGEGNSSARIDEGTFWVKASGASLVDLTSDDLIEVSFVKLFDLMKQENLTDEEVRSGLKSVCLNQRISAVPSVETFLHAILLDLDGVNFIGHTHPTAVNAILCSQKAEEAYSGSLYPDQIVYCGPAPVFVPYTDPGFPLAYAIRDHVTTYINHWGEIPKVILMQNHGFIALGSSPQEVENITAMGVKAAKVILGTYALGGPNFLSQANVERIHTRPDEQYRKEIWGTR